jgi:hypothetical protein
MVIIVSVGSYDLSLVCLAGVWKRGLGLIKSLQSFNLMSLTCE